MNIIILTDYYSPIIKSGAIIIEDLAIELVSQGHKITIVTFTDNPKSSFEIFFDNNIRIIRLRVLTRKYGRLGRLFAEYRYSNLIIKNLINLEHLAFDYIICYSPSIFYGKAVNWIKKKTHAKAYLIIRDIFPEWAVDAGLLKRGALYKYFKSIETELYNSVDHIGIEANSDKNYFSKYFDLKNIEVLDNWSASHREIEIGRHTNILSPGKINIVYGGNIGDAQDLLTLVNQIDHTILDDKAKLIIIGEGSQVSAIKRVIKDKNIRNINIIPAINRTEYLSVISNADIGLVSLNKKLLSNNYPLKMIGYMQYSLPILASVNSKNEIVRLINQKRFGLVSSADDVEAFNTNLLNLINDNELRLSMGQNSRDIFNKRFSVKSATKKILSHLK
jgi:O26-antigen biosynthesis N-acetyl-L-fucosamine transferase